MKKNKLKKQFLHHVEHFYRNFGNEWRLDDFPPGISKHKTILVEYLKELEKLGIVQRKDDDSFIIKEVPSAIIKD